MKPFQKNIGDIEVEGAHGGTGSRQLLLDGAGFDNIDAFTKGFLKTGGIFDWHGHEGYDEFWIVLEGEGIIEYEDGTSYNYKKDDFIFNPAGLSHKISATGDIDSEYYFFRVKK